VQEPIDTLPAPLVGAGSLAGLLSSAAERWGGRCALVHDGQATSYSELEHSARLAASYLRRLGVGAGARVGLQLANSPIFVALYYGILRLGAIVVPQNPLLTPAEAEQNLVDAGARITIASAGSERAVGAAFSSVRRVLVPDEGELEFFAGLEPRSEVHPVDPRDTAVILYTSGTTGRPKGAELTHANLGRNALAAVRMYSLVAHDVLLGVLPLYHSYGQTCTLNGSIAVGARLVLERRFVATVAAALIKQHAVTVLLGVPTMFSDLASCEASPDAFASLRLASSGGAPLPGKVLSKFQARSGAPLYEGYGLSETSPIASFNGLREPRRPGTVGWPIPGTEMRIISADGGIGKPGEVGEIAIRGHNIMKGYWGNPEATAAAIDAGGWFHSADLGTIDEDGCFRVVGRLKDMIIRGGVNIYPRELEDLLHEHPDVRAAAVVGVPDARLGEEVGAAVVLEPDATVTTDELRDWVKARVAPYKYPRHVWTLDQLPTGPTGKILKREIGLPAGIAGPGRPA
jgi:long-chain acyl-CoA synthetase